MTLYAKGSKEGVLTNLYTVINAIEGLKFVDWQRAYNSSINKSRCPGAYINDVRTDKKILLKDITRNDFQVGIVGFVHVDASVDLGTALNTHIINLKTAIMADRQRNDNAYTTNIEIVETDGGNLNPQGVVVIMIKIIYFSTD